MRSIQAAMIGAVGLLLYGTPTLADVFHLNNGGQIEAQLQGQTDTHYQVRTFVGQIELAKADVKQHEPGSTIFDTYDRRVAQLNIAPDALVELAAWCQEHGLAREQRLHLDQALAINPNHAGARTVLGYTRVGNLWVESETVLETQASRRQAAQRAQREAQRELAAQLATLEQQVRRLEGRYFIGRARERDKGYTELQALVGNDAMALEALFNVLTRSRREVFRNAVATLFANNPSLQTTEYLAVMSLEDRNRLIRERATDLLLERDPRQVVPILTLALDERSADIQNRAARLLGQLDAETAIPALIDRLVGQRVKWVERSEEDQQITVLRSTDTFIGRCGPIVVTDQLSPINTYRSVFRRETVPVYRNAIRETLVELTGEDFGFDQDAWSEWHAARSGDAVVSRKSN